MNYYRYGEKCENGLQLNSITGLDLLPDVAKKFFADRMSKNLKSPINSILIKSIDAEVIAFVEKKCCIKYSKKLDEYIIKVENGNVIIYSNDDAGCLNGLMSFLRLLDSESRFNYSYIYDYPFSTFRGIKIMMPARNEINKFKDFVDMMMYFRHNTLMIEVGGAMEFKRHPEINEGWEEYAGFMLEYSGKPSEIQNNLPWRKNSIHANNGGGSYLTQEQVRELVAYANERGIEVIPEVPSTSHCDYLLTRHPEIAERPEDPYPDTFCPSNPKSYELLFDVFDEVIEVFRPKIINVGHDEYYSINVCDRCRKRLMDTSDIFAEDLTKIHDYLASKNIKTMFWCDKIMNVLTEDGTNFGGALNFVYKNWNKNDKLYGIIHPTWPAREKLPKDLICMNWFWNFDEKYDEELKEFTTVFGNFRGELMSNYKQRCGDRITGAMCSNWGATDPVYLQRNRIYFGMTYNDRLYWDAEYDPTVSEQFENACKYCFTELFDYKNGIKENRGGRYIRVLHRTDKSEWYKEFSDGEYTFGEKYDDEYYLGDYVIKYTDGTECREKIYMGEQVGAGDTQWYGENVLLQHLFDNPGMKSAKIDLKLSEVAYSTIPELIDGKIYYNYLLKNPYYDKAIKDVVFVAYPKAKSNFEVKEITFL